MHSEGRDLGDMLASWKKDVAQYRTAGGADLQHAVQEATVMEHTPTAYRFLLQPHHRSPRTRQMTNQAVQATAHPRRHHKQKLRVELRNT